MDICRVCCFKDCKNSALNRKDCYFFEFPVDFHLCLQWVEAIGNRDFFEDFAYGGAVPFRRKYICSEHFGDNDFVMSGNIYTGIKSNAVPRGSPSKNDISAEDPLGDIYVKTEPLENEFWHTRQISNPVVFPVELLQNVKAEEVSSQSFCSNDIDPLTTVQFRLLSRPRSKHAEVVARKRANETPEKRLERLRKNAERAAFKRSIESEKETLVRRQRNAKRNSIRRSLETDVEKEKRRKLNAERQARKRQNETPEQREIRRMKDLLRARRRRLLETEEQSQMRKISDAARAKARRQNETKEERNIRRLNDIIRISRRRGNETFEDRQERLKKNREYSAKKRYIQKLEFELNHPKNFAVDTAMSLRNFEEDVTSMNVNFFQSLGVYPKAHEYHYIGNALPDKQDCQVCQVDQIGTKILPLSNSFNELSVQSSSHLHSTSSLDDHPARALSEDSTESTSDEVSAETMLVLL